MSGMTTKRWFLRSWLGWVALCGAGCNESVVTPIDRYDGGDDPFANRGDMEVDVDQLLKAGCAAASKSADRVPVYLHFVLDGSGSMRQNGKWLAVAPALDAIFADLAARADASFGAGLTVFADQRDATIKDNWAGPYDRMDVPVAYVSDTQLAALRERMRTGPNLGTPTYEVLSGQYPLLRGLSPKAPLLPGGRRVLVFMTDGVPDTDMPAGVNEVPWSLKAASDEYARAPATRTFVIGVGPFPPVVGVDYSPDFLGDLAVAGGTRRSATCDPHEQAKEANLCYFQVTPPASGMPTQAEIDGLKDKFISAVNDIRGQVASCEYALDRINPNNGALIDPAQINVVYIDGRGNKSLVPASGSNGWTYDNPADPKQVLLHGAACDRVKADPMSRVTVVLGCKTILG